MRFCPYVHRTLLVLAAKNIPVEVVNVDLVDKPDWFLRKNPLGKVPVLELNDIIIYDSAICSEWLDGFYSDKPPRILSNDPTKKAKQKMLAEQLSKLGPYMVALVKRTNQDTEHLVEKINNAVDIHEKLLLSTFYHNDVNPGWTDYIVWPFIERLVSLTSFTNRIAGITKEKHPKLSKYVETMSRRPEVKCLARTPEEYIEFSNSMTEKKPNYNLGLQSHI